MTQMTVKRSVGYMMVWLFLLLLLIIFGFALFFKENIFAGIVLVASGLASSLMILKGMNDKQPRIVLDDEGITASEFAGVKLYWRDVKAADVKRYPKVGRIITFSLENEAKYLDLRQNQRRQQRIPNLFGITPFFIIAEGLDTPVHALHTEIIKRMGNRDFSE